MKKGLWTGVLLVMLMSVLAVSANEISLRAQNRLLNTETAMTVPQGNVEVSLQLDYLTHSGKRYFSNSWNQTSKLRRQGNFHPKARVYDWSMTARVGVAENLDAFFSTGWTDIKDRSMPYEDNYGRGVDGVTLGIKYAVPLDDQNLVASYQPSLKIPLSQYRTKTGHLGPGENFWSFDQTAALTRTWEEFSGSVALTQTIPMGNARNHYSRPFLQEQHGARGTTALDMGVVYTSLPVVQPLVELNYIHEWISHGHDSDLLATTVGAKASLGSVAQLMAGIQYPLAGRNSYRTTTFQVGMVAEF